MVIKFILFISKKKIELRLFSQNKTPNYKANDVIFSTKNEKQQSYIYDNNGINKFQLKAFICIL